MQRHQLGRAELAESGIALLCKPERLRVQRLLEERAREARVAEAFAALDAVEDPRELRLGVRCERVLVACGDVARDLEQLAGRVVGKDDLAREARAQTRDSSRGSCA